VKKRVAADFCRPRSNRWFRKEPAVFLCQAHILMMVMAAVRMTIRRYLETPSKGLNLCGCIVIPTGRRQAAILPSASVAATDLANAHIVACRM
jgi:hypothetical protein